MTSDGNVYKVLGIYSNYIYCAHTQNSYSGGFVNGLRMYTVEMETSKASYTYTNLAAGGISVQNLSSNAVAADTVTIAY